MSTYLTLQEALTDKLQNSGIDGIVWGDSGASPPTAGSPYYGIAEAPAPEPPYVWFNCPPSRTEHQFVATDTDGSSLSVIFDFIEVTFQVVADQRKIASLGSPDSTVSVVRWLDSITNNPTYLDGALFVCGGWARKSWQLQPDLNSRNPYGGFVWVATAVYEAMIQRPYPNTIS